MPGKKNLRMKAARAAAGLSQADLAQAVGVTRQTIGLIEAGWLQSHAQPVRGNLQSAARYVERLVLGRRD